VEGEKKVREFIKDQKNWADATDTIFKRMKPFLKELIQSKLLRLKFVNYKIGYGIEALKDIPAKTLLPLTGYISNGLDRTQHDDSLHCFPRASKKYKIMRGYTGNLDGPVYFVNHNCKANAAMNIRKIKGSHSIEVHTRIAVKKGEQITFFYGRQYFTQRNPIMKCLCGNCNGTPKAI
jgi:hypothetical protein